MATYLIQFDEQCELCLLPVAECDCPECPICGEVGNPLCTMIHDLPLTPVLGQGIPNDLIARITAR